ncbi:hypothetical protein [Longivirga aurantiaca]|uniref:DUF3592 domain-containing protein n=1 Tax=Longivirga aurantiaca TaxID=1837743 RepID=A0ABW1T045_9ACTN
MTEIPEPSSTRRWGRGGLVIAVLGALALVGSALLGFLLMQGPRDLSPVAYGERLTVTTERSSSVAVYTPTGLEAPPACQVATSAGADVELGPVERYSQASGLETTYSFATAGGVPYQVSCGTVGETGEFAAAETRRVSVPLIVAVGSMGLVLLLGGLVLARLSGRSIVG